MSQSRDRRSDQEKRAAKKAAVLDSKRKSRVPLILMLLCTALVLGGGVLFLGQRPDSSPPIANLVAPAAQASEVLYDAATFADGQARFFLHQAPDGTRIKYFILRSADGVIRAAFDACDSCWPAGKGYHQDGDEMVCGNCRMRFHSIKINEVKGGCNPAPLRREVRDGQLVIRVADILGGANYFQFDRREG